MGFMPLRVLTLHCNPIPFKAARAYAQRLCVFYSPENKD